LWLGWVLSAAHDTTNKVSWALLNFVKNSAYIFAQYAYRKQLHAAEKSDRDH
jgi:hypothetical protein